MPELSYVIKVIMRNKDESEVFLRLVIKEYLTNLQSGKLGEVTSKQLQNAGILHAFLEGD